MTCQQHTGTAFCSIMRYRRFSKRCVHVVCIQHIHTLLYRRPCSVAFQIYINMSKRCTTAYILCRWCIGDRDKLVCGCLLYGFSCRWPAAALFWSLIAQCSWPFLLHITQSLLQTACCSRLDHSGRAATVASATPLPFLSRPSTIWLQLQQSHLITPQ